MDTITQKERDDIYKKALARFGGDAQIMMLVEEMSELTKCICKVFRQQMSLLDNSVLEEIADVEITLEQLKLIIDQDSKIEEIKTRKLRRLEKLISQS